MCVQNSIDTIVTIVSHYSILNKTLKYVAHVMTHERIPTLLYVYTYEIS